MIHLSRRSLLSAASALALASLLPDGAANAADLSKLLEPPANGEMPLGPETAKVTIVEYASASCPHCAAFNNDVMPGLKAEYIDTGKLRFLLREFPHNDAALGGFMVARCAPPDKYHALVDVMFRTQADWVQAPLEGLKKIALQAGFTEASFNECLKNTDVAKGILAERKRGEDFGVQGIPTIFINGELYEGDRTLDAMKAKIEPLLQAAQ